MAKIGGGGGKGKSCQKLRKRKQKRLSKKLDSQSIEKEPKLRAKTGKGAKSRRKGGKTKRAGKKQKKNTRNAKQPRNAKNGAGRVLREREFGRRVPSESAESEAGPINQVHKGKRNLGDKCVYVCGSAKRRDLCAMVCG